MADFTFPCPHCHQDIQCDDAWSGHQTQCPICHKGLVIPANTPAPAAHKEVSHLGKQLVAPPSGGSRLKAGATQVARQNSGTGTPQRGFQKTATKKKSPVVTIGIVGAALVAVGAAVYFGLPYLQRAQEDMNAKRRQAEKESGGGEAGHIAEVIGVLDATDPNRMDDSAGGTPGSEALGSDPGATDPNAQAAAAAPALPTKVIPPVWTLDLFKAKIPESKANGTISGADFVVENARLDRSTTGYVLTLRQGTNASPDRGMMVYLKTNPGEFPTNKTFTVSQDERASQVTKLWKTNPRYAASTRNFFTGYALKLELGPMSESGVVNGKIFLALPDTEQSVVAGMFNANTATAAAATMSYEQPMQQAPTAEQRAADAAFQRRYGTTRR